MQREPSKGTSLLSWSFMEQATRDRARAACTAALCLSCEGDGRGSLRSVSYSQSEEKGCLAGFAEQLASFPFPCTSDTSKPCSCSEGSTGDHGGGSM